MEAAKNPNVISTPQKREEISIYKEILRLRPLVVAQNDKINSCATNTYAGMTLQKIYFITPKMSIVLILHQPPIVYFLKLSLFDLYYS